MSLRHAWDANLTAVLLDQGLAAPLIADSPALRRRLRACMRGSGSNTPQLKLLVLGASMACGNMNCGGRGRQCSGDRIQPMLAWPAKLEAQLRAGLGCGVTVQVNAFGGWTSEVAAHRLHDILKGRAEPPDLLLLDASANDAGVSQWGKDAGLTSAPTVCTVGPGPITVFYSWPGAHAICCQTRHGLKEPTRALH